MIKMYCPIKQEKMTFKKGRWRVLWGPGREQAVKWAVWAEQAGLRAAPGTRLLLRLSRRPLAWVRAPLTDHLGCLPPARLPPSGVQSPAERPELPKAA